MGHQRTPAFLTVVFFPCKSPSLPKLPVVPPVTDSPFSPFLWQGQGMPSPWRCLPCHIAFRSQLCVCSAGRPRISSLHLREDCLQSRRCPAWLSRVLCTSGAELLKYVLRSTDFRANGFESNPSSTTSYLTLACYPNVGALLFSSVKLV